MYSGLHAFRNDNKHAYAGQLNSFTHLGSLLVLHDRVLKLHSVIVRMPGNPSS
jgi:hypothetical protein